MRVLTLTWEFPPQVTGGLSMACYGIVKALLGLGVEVDLVVPSREELYFPMRKEEDADSLPVAFVDPEKQKRFGQKLTGREIMEEFRPIVTAYYATDKTKKKTYESEILEFFQGTEASDFILQLLSEDRPLHREVRDYTLKTVSMARGIDFDMIHAHDWLTYPAAILIKKMTGKPLVAHVHSTEFDRAGGPGDRKIHDVEYTGTQDADRVIAVSGYTANMVADKYRVDSDKIRTVHNAFTLDLVGRGKKRIFKEPTVVFVGRITLQKGPDYFLEVAQKVLQQEKKVRFVMAGKGDMEKEILRKAASFGMGTRFLFAGFLKREELEPILSAADIFVMPSVSEPFGIVALEAMSCGAVAIVAKQSGVAEAIENAFKVDFWDVDRIVSIIVDLVRNPEKLAEISRSSIGEVAKLEWDEAGRKILDVYRELVKV